MRHRWLVVALVPTLAFAQAREEYARQWPIQVTDASAGAYRVELQDDVYRTIASPAMRDVDVIDARGKPVAADVFGPDAPIASAPQFASVAWFTIDVPRAGDDGGLALIARRDTTGRILSLEAQTSPSVESAPRAYLFDLSRWKTGVQALVFEFPANVDVQSAFRVEASDDLEAWRTVNPRVQLLSLNQQGSRLSKTEVPLDASAKYVRLVPVTNDASFAFANVRARVASAAKERALTWTALQGHATNESRLKAWEFESNGRFPIEQADVVADANAAVEWVLLSRDDPDAEWQLRAGPWVAFRVGGAANSAPASLDGRVRDRHWRLVAQSGTPSAAPQLKLGYRPDVVVFLAQGTPPYALVAGSARASRAQAPLPQLIDAVRVSKGSDWQPMRATLGAPTDLAADALEKRTTPEDWKQWLLWALLVVGAAIVAGFAFSVLRRPPASEA